MLNFLQQKNKNQIIFEYLLRVCTVLLIFIFISISVLISLFLPSFFFVKFKNNTIAKQLETTKRENVGKGEDPVSIIRDTNRLAIALSDTPSHDIKNNEIIGKIISLKNDGIKISSISIDTNITGGRKIIISGFSNKRDNLTLFDKEIRTEGSFSSVSFPVSNFIKSTDSDFTATLTLQ